MPEISSTMYPIVGAAAIAILLLLVLVLILRRRRVNRGPTEAGHEDGTEGREDDSLGVKLIRDDEEVAEDDEQVANGTETSPEVKAGSPAMADTADASPGGAGSQSAGSKGLVAWGPNETGHDANRTVDEPQTATADSPPANASGTSETAPRSGSEASSEAGHESGGQPAPERPKQEQHSPDDGAAPPSAGAGPPEKDSVEPEGQPFERDGSWWFRRDGELLVYDNATSEWKAAPETGSASPATTTPVTAANGDKAAHGETLKGGATTATLERGGLHSHEGPLHPRSAGATSWKCRTCGATNGSAASGCRMCFSARP